MGLHVHLGDTLRGYLTTAVAIGIVLRTRLNPLWLIAGTAAYIKETGDTSILNHVCGYDDAPDQQTPLYEHLQRALRYTLDRLGPHGLPLIGRADWNDCLNLNCFSETPDESFQTTGNRTGRTAESVFIAGMFVGVAPDYVPPARPHPPAPGGGRNAASDD